MMEESSSMQNNPYPGEQTTEQMEDLQPKPKPVPQTPAAPAAHTATAHHAATAGPGFQPLAVDADNGPREDAFTVKFAIGKLNDYLQWFLMVMETFLALRFVLKMFGANPDNFFA